MIYDLKVVWHPEGEEEEFFSLRMSTIPGLTLIDGLAYVRENCKIIQDAILEGKEEERKRNNIEKLH